MEQAAALSGLESAVQAAWLREVTQPGPRAEEPFVAQPGQTVSHLREALAARALFAEVGPPRKALALAEENQHEKAAPVLLLEEQLQEERAVVPVFQEVLKTRFLQR